MATRPAISLGNSDLSDDGYLELLSIVDGAEGSRTGIQGNPSVTIGANKGTIARPSEHYGRKYPKLTPEIRKPNMSVQ